MILNRRHFVAALIASSAGASSPVLARPGFDSNRAPFPEELVPPAPAVPSASNGPPLLRQALASLQTHSGRLARRDRIGIADYGIHSGQKRFTVYNVESGTVEREFLVAHGKGSDLANSGYVQQFSNEYGSLASSRGAYCTANVYYGKYGRSQRLIGLDPENDAALERAIVMHGAHYVDESMAQTQGRIGRSFGCFSFEMSEIGPVMEMLGEGRLLYSGKSA